MLYQHLICAGFSLLQRQTSTPMAGSEQYGNREERWKRYSVRVRADDHDAGHGEGAQGPRRQHPWEVRYAKGVHFFLI